MSSVRERLEREAGIVVVPAAPVAAGLENDPSMPDRPTVAVPSAPAGPAPVVAAPVVAAPPVVVPEPVVTLAPVAEEKRYEYQPTDENGRPMGGKQVIIYRTQEELIEKFQNNNVLLQRQLRKVKREVALGVPEEQNDAEKFTNVVEFKPRELTADERFKLAQGIVNPETFTDARDTLIESVFGAKPSQVASTLNDAQRFIVRQRAVENYIDFVNTTGFSDTPENRELVTGWLGTRNLAPTVANFTIAQKRLQEAGLLQETPVVHQEPVAAPTPAAPVAAPVVVPPVVSAPNPQVPPTPPARIGEAEEAQAKRHSHVPSGLTPTVASSAGESLPSTVGGLSLTLADIDKMPSDTYKQRLKDPAFAKYVNQLETDAAARRRARQLGQ